MVVREKLGPASFLVAILVDEDEHHNTDDHKCGYRNAHCYPEECICPGAMLRSNGQSIAVKMCNRIPEEPAQAQHHKYNKEKSIKAIAGINLTLLLSFSNTYQTAQPEDHIQYGPQQYDT